MGCVWWGAAREQSPQRWGVWRFWTPILACGSRGVVELTERVRAAWMKTTCDHAAGHSAAVAT
eukprot:4606472-Prymnesium_polylepis.1